MRFAIASDLHLDDVPQNVAQHRIAEINAVEADYMMITGDICNNRNSSFYLPRIQPKVKKVLVTKGNHEFYYNDLGYKVSYPDNFFCLNEKGFFIDGDILIVGDVLWTHIPKDKKESIERYMVGDYTLILDRNGKPITSEVLNEEHRRQKEAILNTILSNLDKRIVVATHHSPSFEGVSTRFIGHTANIAFHSNAIAEFDHLSNIELWVHGHTHTPLDYMHKDIRVVCNPMGYSGEVSDRATIKYVDL